jgi:hypothetical protein
MQQPETPPAGTHGQYASRLEIRRAQLDVRQKRQIILEKLRGLTLVLAIATGFFAFGPRVISAWWVFVPIAAFAWFGARSGAVATECANLGRAVKFYERGLARLDGSWAGSGETGARFLDPQHLYAKDLDIFGPASLFELLCIARTRMGEETLAAWLLDPAPPDAVPPRQEAVAELAPRLDLREDLAVLGENARDGVHANALSTWGEREPILQPSAFRTVAWILSALGAIAAVALFVYLFAQLGLYRLPAKTLVQLEVYVLSITVILSAIRPRFKKRTDKILNDVEEAARDLGLLAAVLRKLEAERFTSPRLAFLRGQLDIQGWPPSRRISKLNRLVELTDSRDHRIMKIIGPLLLWDLHLSYAIEDWRRTSGPAMRRWLQAVGEMEALSSLAGYSYEHPHDVFPELIARSPCFEGEALGHPLLPEDRAVPNDVHIGGELRCLIVSGSNMSGKSTLLRTVGVNAVLAQAGAPVRARRLRISPLAAGASIQTQDSLQEGTSRFYAEITRLRLIMEKTAGSIPVLFLIDEMLHGTNSHDRRIGAEAIVHGLIDRGAIGLVTTHDLALTEIANALGQRAANVHFADHMEDGRMCFDFRMRPGVVEKSNAIELMRSVGLEL